MNWTPATRTRLAVLLAIPLAATLLFMFACLPAPVGDPEKSTVDPGLNGAWIAEDNDSKTIVLMRPWDSHTYFMQYFHVNKDPKGNDNAQMNFKAWVTTLGGKAFVCAEPLQSYDYVPGSSEGSEKPFWVIGQVEKGENTVTYRDVDENSPLVKDLTKRGQLEDAIAANVDKNELYGTAITFNKVTKENAAVVQETLNRFMGNNSGPK